MKIVFIDVALALCAVAFFGKLKPALLNSFFKVCFGSD